MNAPKPKQLRHNLPKDLETLINEIEKLLPSWGVFKIERACQGIWRVYIDIDSMLTKPFKISVEGTSTQNSLQTALFALKEWTSSEDENFSF